MAILQLGNERTKQVCSVCKICFSSKPEAKRNEEVLKEHDAQLIEKYNGLVAWSWRGFSRPYLYGCLLDKAVFSSILQLNGNCGYARFEENDC